MGFGVFVVWSLGLLLIDAWRNTLPNILTLPAAVLALGACLVHPQWAWGLLWGLAYLAFGRGIGGGDIKLAVPTWGGGGRDGRHRRGYRGYCAIVPAHHRYIVGFAA